MTIGRLYIFSLKTFLAATLLSLNGCGGGGGSSSPGGDASVNPSNSIVGNPTPSPSPSPSAPPPITPPPIDIMSSPLMNAANWEIGPIIDKRNYSLGMPLHPTQTADGWAFDFPLIPSSVHYVTYPYGSLSGKTHIVLKYRVETDPGVKIYPVCCPLLDSMGPTMYIQEKNDDWNTDTKRWWATFNSPYPIKAGEYVMDVPLDANWTSIGAGTEAINHPTDFADSIRNAERVGFTFGGGNGYGHGVYADGRARFVVTSFTIE